MFEYEKIMFEYEKHYCFSEKYLIYYNNVGLSKKPCYENNNDRKLQKAIANYGYSNESEKREKPI